MVLSITLIMAYILIIIKLRQRAKRWRGTYDPNTESEKVWSFVSQDYIAVTLHLQLTSKDNAKQLYLFPWMYIVIFIFPFINR